MNNSRPSVAARILDIPPSATVRIADTVTNMRRQGIEIVDFSALGLLLKEKYSDDFYLHYEHEIDNVLSKRIRWLERVGYLNWVSNEGRVSIIPNEGHEKYDQSIFCWQCIREPIFPPVFQQKINRNVRSFNQSIEI